MYNIDFYVRENGKCPVKDFLDGLQKKMLAKALEYKKDHIGRSNHEI